MPIVKEMKEYRKTYWLLLDCPMPDGPPPEPTRSAWEPKHLFYLRNLEYMIRQITDFELVRISMPRGTKEERFLKNLEQFLEDKTARDLIIVYWHGTGGDEQEDYTWMFKHSYPKNGINAYDFIGKLCGCAADSILLVDGYMPTNFTNRWKRNSGITEIITSGGSFQNTEGKTEERAGKGFTDTMLTSLEKFAAEGRKLKTLPHIMRDHPDIPFHPVRNDVGSKVGFGSSRLHVGPSYAGKAGKISFYGEVRMDPKNKDDDEEDEEEDEEVREGAEAVDEGYHDTETEGDGKEGSDGMGMGGMGPGDTGLGDSGAGGLFVEQ